MGEATSHPITLTALTESMGRRSSILSAFNSAPRHEGVLGEWMHSSAHYWFRH